MLGGKQLPVCWLCVRKLGQEFPLVLFFIQATEIQAPCWSVPAAPFGAEILRRDFSRIDLLTFVSFRDFALREHKAPGKAPKLHQV